MTQQFYILEVYFSTPFGTFSIQTSRPDLTCKNHQINASRGDVVEAKVSSRLYSLTECSSVYLRWLSTYLLFRFARLL